MRGGAILGTTLLPNLSLAMGNNTMAATSAFQVCRGDLLAIFQLMLRHTPAQQEPAGSANTQ